MRSKNDRHAAEKCVRLDIWGHGRLNIAHWDHAERTTEGMAIVSDMSVRDIASSQRSTNGKIGQRPARVRRC